MPSRLIDRQCECEIRAAPDFALHRDMATVSLHKTAHNRQANPCPTRFTTARGISAIEALEDIRQMLGANAIPGIRHTHFNLIGSSLGAYCNASLLRRMHHSIIE